MKTVTVEQFLTLDPCYDEDKVRAIAGKRKRWTALQVLALREEFIDAPILQEFACRCAEEALKLVPEPDPRSVAAIEVKRRWLHGDATDEELDAARAAANEAAWAAWAAAWDARAAANEAAWAARAAASEAAWAAWAAASDAASAAARAAASAAAWAASEDAWAASEDAWAAASATQVKMLIALLKGN